MHKFDPYTTRPVEFINQVNTEGWRIKIYGISAESLPLPQELVAEGMQSVLPHLPQPAVTEQRYGVGFLIIHQGTMRNLFLLDWWEKGQRIQTGAPCSSLGSYYWLKGFMRSSAVA